MVKGKGVIPVRGHLTKTKQKHAKLARRPTKKPKSDGGGGLRMAEKVVLIAVFLVLACAAGYFVFSFVSLGTAQEVGFPLVGSWGGEGSSKGKFIAPRGLAASEDEVFLVAHQLARLNVYNKQGVFRRSWGGEGTGAYGFQKPYAVALDPQGNVLVMDTWNGYLKKYTKAGKFITKWGGEEYSFYGPRGIAVAPDGTIYVADTGQGRLVQLSPRGEFLDSWGRPGKGKECFRDPMGVAVGPAGNIYVADALNHRVMVLSPRGKFLRRWRLVKVNGAYTSSEHYLAVDRRGRVFVTDPNASTIQVFSGEGKALGLWQKVNSELAFGSPAGVAVSPQGDIYVVDERLHKIFAFRDEMTLVE